MRLPPQFRTLFSVLPAMAGVAPDLLLPAAKVLATMAKMPANHTNWKKVTKDVWIKRLSEATCRSFPSASTTLGMTGGS